ncbi:hypothetical protein [Richelia sinica]|uniref:hypothetical protein n=1 Tax=Richelia sinica TaxID=1357545 RepID=UPI001683F4F4|nr:hypothetical protein [Richelia sinica]MBD2667309.1 hypothetical protein [Richelia sinica FACHB-800]
MANLSTEQIKTILRGTEETLKMVLASEQYQKLQQSQYFDTTNDLTLGDAIQALSEVWEAIVNVQYSEEMAAIEAKKQLDTAN